MSVERSIRVCAHKGQAKITPGRDDTRAIFNDVTSRRSFLSRIKGVFAAATIIATYDAKLTRDLSSSVKGRDAFCSAIVIAHFSTTKTTFQPDFNRGLRRGWRKTRFQQVRGSALSRSFAVCSRSLAAKNLFATRFRTRWLIIGCEKTRFRPGSSSRIIPGTRRAII
jgi:hypothetical protein